MHPGLTIVPYLLSLLETKIKCLFSFAHIWPWKIGRTRRFVRGARSGLSWERGRFWSLTGTHVGHHLLVSCLDRFVGSRVKVCGLEMPGRMNRDTKEVQRHRIESGGQPSEYWICLCLFSKCFIHPNPKGMWDGGRQKTALTSYKEQVENYLFSSGNIKYLYPELSILLFRQGMQWPHLRLSIL